MLCGFPSGLWSAQSKGGPPVVGGTGFGHYLKGRTRRIGGSLWPGGTTGSQHSQRGGGGTKQSEYLHGTTGISVGRVYVEVRRIARTEQAEA